MGIFVSVFSLIMVNFTNINQKIIDRKYIATVNLSLGIVISLFLGLIVLLVNHKEINKKAFILYIVGIVLLAVLLAFVI